MKEPADICGRSFKFSVRIVKLCIHIDKHSHTAWPLTRQLMKSGTSIGANVEESQAAQRRSDFVNKLQISLKECRETLYWLRLLIAVDVVPRSRLAELLTEAEELGKIIGSIIVSTKNSSSRL